MSNHGRAGAYVPDHLASGDAHWDYRSSGESECDAAAE
jgi:hypothetical protein